MSAISDKATALGGVDVLGSPQGPESRAPDGHGLFQHFGNGWSIYWTPETGAHEVHGAIRGKWSGLGWERSFLGYPVTDETATPDGVGRFNHFQAGSIYWTGQSGAHEVHGAIRGWWAARGWERGTLGYPLTDELRAPDDSIRFQHFQWGSLRWTPTEGPSEGCYDRELRGIADMHSHPAAHLAFGGQLLWGQPEGPADSALAWCTPAHGLGGTGLGGAVGNLFMAGFEGGPGHLVGGYPQFDGWPRFTTRVHQQMYVDWLRRAHGHGLRLMVALAVNNQLLAKEFGGRDYDDRTAVETQLRWLREFVARHSDFMEVALGPADARRIISRGRLAVVLGIEVDTLGGWNHPDQATDDEIRSYLEHLHNDLGVRYLFPIHLADNALGGTAIYNDTFNVLNRFLNNDYVQVRDGSASGIQFRMIEAETAIEQWYRLSGWYSPPDYGQVPGGHANQRGLTRQGRAAVLWMMRLGLLIDIDHMSERSADATLGIAEQTPYPVVAGHAAFRDLAWRRSETEAAHKLPSEYARTGPELARIRRLGGMVGVGLRQGDLRPRGSRVSNDAAGSTKSWAQAYQYAVDMLGDSVAIGTDMNGLPGSAAPRFGLNACYDLHNHDSADELRKPQRASQVEAQRGGVRYATPILDYRAYRFEGVLEGEVYDMEARDIWEAVAIYQSGVDPDLAEMPGLPKRTPWQQGKIRNLAKGFRARSPDDLENPLFGGQTYNEEKAAFLVKAGIDPDPGSDPELVRLYQAVLRIWRRWQAMTGPNPPLSRSTAGQRDFDLNLDGFAHYGMLPDFIQDLVNVGLGYDALDPLLSSAERFVRVWETCERYARLAGGKPGWRWCRNCEALHHNGDQPAGPCPAGGAHVVDGSWVYGVLFAGATEGQPGWRWCQRCYQLHYPADGPGICPAGGGHDPTSSGNYQLLDDSGVGQPGWRWCYRCYTLFFAGFGTQGACAAGGPHDATRSQPYRLAVVG